MSCNTLLRRTIFRFVTRKLVEKPDATLLERSACGAVLDGAGQELAKEYDHIDIPPIRPITTRIELLRAICPCCQGAGDGESARGYAPRHAVRSGIASMIAYLHGYQMIVFRRLTEVCQSLFGLTISQDAIANVLARVGGAIAAPAERIAAEVRPSEVSAS